MSKHRIRRDRVVLMLAAGLLCLGPVCVLAQTTPPPETGVTDPQSVENPGPTEDPRPGQGRNWGTGEEAGLPGPGWPTLWFGPVGGQAGENGDRREARGLDAGSADEQARAAGPAGAQRAARKGGTTAPTRPPGTACTAGKTGARGKTVPARETGTGTAPRLAAPARCSFPAP